MNFSLIQVTSSQGNQVKGVWVQHHIGGTLASAIEKAKRTEEANGNKLDIAVIPFSSILNIESVRCTGAERLDERRLDLPPSPYGRWADDWPN